MDMPAVVSNYEQLSEEETGDASKFDPSLKAALHKYAHSLHKYAHSFLGPYYFLKVVSIILAIIWLIALKYYVSKYVTMENEVARLTTINEYCMNATHLPPPAAFQTTATDIKTLAAASYTWQGCGHGAPEARANNCRFDLMLSAWLPESCYDVGLHEQFLLAGNYSWYWDESLPDEVSEAEVRRGEHVYVSRGPSSSSRIVATRG